MANLSNINGKFVVEQTTGYVGVGTTDPSYPIEVLNASAEIALNASGGSIYRLQSDSTDSFRINKNGVGDRLVIDGSGNSTFAGDLSILSGKVFKMYNAANNGWAQIKYNETDNIIETNRGIKNSGADWLLSENSVNSFVCANEGSFGIGTTGPRSLLEIGGSGTLGSVTNKVISTIIDGGYSTLNSLQYNVNAFIGTTYGTSDIFAQTSGEVLKNFYVGLVAPNSYFNGSRYSITQGGAERLTVVQGGNVGIGTTGPGTFLQLGTYAVAGKYINQATYPDIPSEHMMHITAPSTNAYYGGGISFGETAFTAANIVVRDAGGSGALDLCFGTGTSAGVTEKMRIANNGNVGIGTASPDQKLEVVGSIKIANSNSRLVFGTENGTDRRALEGNTSGSLLQIGESYTDIALQGNVGIGTTSPSTELQVESTNPIITLQRNNNGNAGGAVQFRGSDNVVDWQIGTNQVVGLGLEFNFQNSNKVYIETGGYVGIGTTNPSSELEVAGRAIVEKLEVARYSDSNAPAPVYIGRSANPIGQGGIFRLGSIQSSSTVNKIDEPFLITYSSGHWGSQPMFFAEFTITYYRGSYVKYWAQHEVSGSRLEIMDGPYGGQIISGGAPVSRTITQLCSSCNGGQPVYKCVWKWSNSGTYIKTTPVISLVDGPGTARVYTSGSSSESAIDTLYGSASSPGAGYLLMGINNAQAAGYTGLQTQN